MIVSPMSDHWNKICYRLKRIKRVQSPNPRTNWSTTWLVHPHKNIEKFSVKLWFEPTGHVPFRNFSRISIPKGFFFRREKRRKVTHKLYEAKLEGHTGPLPVWLFPPMLARSLYWWLGAPKGLEGQDRFRARTVKNGGLSRFFPEKGFGMGTNFVIKWIFPKNASE